MEDENIKPRSSPKYVLILTKILHVLDGRTSLELLADYV